MQKDLSVYRDYIEKERIQVFIQTSKQALVGFLHIRPGVRLKDTLNRKDEEFLAVSDVILIDQNKKLPFILIRADEIVWLAPFEKDQEA